MTRRAIVTTIIRCALSVLLLWTISRHAHWSVTLALALVFVRCEAIDLLIGLRGGLL